MLDRQNDDFLGSFVHPVVGEVAVLARHEFADALDSLRSPQLRKPQEQLKRLQDRRPYRNSGLRIALAQVIRDRKEVRNRARREAELHLSKRRKAASTSASATNSCRLAWPSPSSTAAR